MSDVINLAPVRQALATALRRIKIANGYDFDLPNAHVFPAFMPAEVGSSNTASYPKAMVFTSEGTIEQRISDNYRWVANFTIYFAVSRLQPSDDLTALIDGSVKAVGRVLADDPTLGNLVENARLTHFVTDRGVFDPIGAALMDVEVEQYVNH